MRIVSLLIILLSCTSYFCTSQINGDDVVHPKFTSFDGEVFSMPILKQKRGKGYTVHIQEHYGDNIYGYQKLGSISLDEINIQETNSEQGYFPGVNKKTRFAMVLNAQMVIHEKACYEFTLNSDDGSILWINDDIIVDNDGGHRMRLKRDFLVLKRGNYNVKLWYFQGMPDRFGFIFNALNIGSPQLCSKSELVDSNPDIDKIVLDHLNFENSKFELNERGLSELLKISELLKTRRFKSIHVISHTDNIGSYEFNNWLSIERAKYVANRLQKLLKDDTLIFSSNGKGELDPINSNSTPKDRAKNRRVEIVIK